MIYFDSLEEMRSAYLLDSDHDQSYLVRKNYEYVFTKQDLENVKFRQPDSWLDKTDYKWFYYDIIPSIWYDYYLWDGEKWCLGKDSWDGIQYAEEPTWGFNILVIFSALNLACLKPKQRQLIIRIKN